MEMRKLLVGLSLVMAVGSANAAIIDSSEWEVTGISGSWDAATTGWWLETTTPTAAEADGFMSDGYIGYASSYSSPQNGYSTYENSQVSVLEIDFNDAYDFSNLDLWITRNATSATTINVFGQNDELGWESILSTNTGALGLSTGYTFGLETGSLSLSSPSAFDQIRVEFGTQGQVILHELVFEGELAAAKVPEPALIALLGFGLLGFGFTRRK